MPVEIFARPWPSRFRLHANIRFRGGAAQICFSHCHNFSRSRTLCRMFKAPNSRSVRRARLMRLAAVRQNSQKWHARALRGQARRQCCRRGRALRARGMPFSSRRNPSGSGFPFFTSSMVTARRKISCATVPSSVWRNSRRVRPVKSASSARARPSLQARVRDQPLFPRHIAGLRFRAPIEFLKARSSPLRTEPPRRATQSNPSSSASHRCSRSDFSTREFRRR